MISLLSGTTNTLAAGIIYALPSRRVLIRAQPITNIMVSNDNATYAAPVADAQGQFETTAGFIRDSVGGSIVHISSN